MAWTLVTAVLVTILVALAILLWGLMIFYTVRYRRRCLKLIEFEAESAPSKKYFTGIANAFLSRRLVLFLGFILPLTLGAAVLCVSALNYGFSAFLQWPESVLGFRAGVQGM